MANTVPRINLLKDKQTPFVDKFINWALTIGRLIVILTELAALSAFVYRFSLDRKIIDLHSKIKQEQAIVNYLKNNEKTYRNLQERISLASSFSNSGASLLKTYKDILSFAPKDMAINSFHLNENRISLSANIQLSSSLNKFINALKTYPGADTVSLDNLENKPANSIITFSATVNLKQAKN